MFNLYAIISNKRFTTGVMYVDTTIQSFQRDSRIFHSIPFLLNLEIDKIIVYIDERSDNYTVGQNITTAKVINLYARGNQVHSMEKDGVISIKVMGHQYSRQSNKPC